MKQLTLLALCIVTSLTLLAQGAPTLVTPASQRLQAYDQQQKMIDQSLVAQLPFKNIGPSVQSGRVSDIAVNPADPSHFYVAYASGGLWKTTNNGTTFEPVFDNQAVITTGAVAVDWNKNTIWLGTGEVNSSRSSYAGLGMYRSTDGGQTWEHKGLSESHHIGRIILHPNDPNTVWVAVLGHLYSPNAERGIYKTSDGGHTWQKTLFANNNAGGIELIIDAKDPNHLYAATWERERRAWNFVESGEGSGIYESNDGGATWSLIATAASGFPTGEGAGRIGLAMGYDGKKAVLYASIDNYDRREEEEPEEDKLTKDALRSMSSADFAALEDKQLKQYLASNNFDEKYTPEKVKQMVAKGEIKPATLVEFTESANSLLFSTPVKGLEVYKLNGKKWKKTHEGYIDQAYFSYGYYFGQIRVSPHDVNKLYVMGVPVLRSDDGGANWKSIMGPNVHADHHALWSNPDRAGHLILGNDGGINISYDDGENWIKCNHPPLAQFYYAAVDMAEPYRVYGGLQDNGVWMGDHTYKASSRWQQSGHYPYKSIMGGDGMQVAIDTRDNETVYTGFQFGNYFRLNTKTEDSKYITPSHELGERPYRWNWQAPIHLSEHNPDILYMGSNFLHRSMDQGNNFIKVSEDLTAGGQKGDVPYGTLSAIHESPMRFGLLYTGSDDGLVHISKDGGTSWQDISKGLPRDMWISRIQASKYAEGRVYVALNGYRWDNTNVMLYRSDDYGQSWEMIGRDIPMAAVNVVKEDSENEQIIYVGTDHGAYVSFNMGRSFHPFYKGLAAAPVHDIVIHPRDKDIIIATHGRSLYLASAKEIQALDEELMAENIHVFEIATQRSSSRWGKQSFFSKNEVHTDIPVYVAQSSELSVEVYAKDGPLLKSFTVTAAKGINYLAYDYTLDEKQLEAYQSYLNEQATEEQEARTIKQADDTHYYLTKGKYTVKISTNGATSQADFELK